MKKILVYIIFLLPALNLYGQPSGYVSVITGNKITDVPAFEREKTVFFSIRDFSDAASINYFYNPSNGKIELQFDDYLFKITARNPYFIVTERSSGKNHIYQLPTSSYVLNDKIFIPVKLSIIPLEKAWGKKISFTAPGKLIIGKDINIKSPSFFDETKTDKSPPVVSFNISGIVISEKANGTLITIKSDKRIPSYYSSYKDGVLKIIFREVHADSTKTDRYNLNGLVKSIKTRSIGDDAEFQIEVGEEYSTNEVMNVEKSNDVQVTIHNKIFTKQEDELKTRKKWEFDVIVIDPGHGGKDPGAIGLNKIKEKDVNLDVALKLGKLLEENMKDVKVVYTRDKDEFVDLYKRGKIANEQDGKLFISIHCNSTKKKPTDINGVEVYLLRPGRTQEAIAIAETENSVIEYEDNPTRYEQLTDENFILVSMAHSAYMKYSEHFAEMLNNQFKFNTKLHARGVKQAGFYVLVGASMPSVLIESGFISNKKDKNYLDSESGKKQLAEAIFNAVKEYREYYEKQMEAEL